jgi:hypothetical protein
MSAYDPAAPTTRFSQSLARPSLIELAGFRLLTDSSFDSLGEYLGAVRLEKTARPALSAD